MSMDGCALVARGWLAYWVQDNSAAAGWQVVVAQQLSQAVQLVPRAAATLSEQATACRGARPIEPVSQAGELSV